MISGRAESQATASRREVTFCFTDRWTWACCDLSPRSQNILIDGASIPWGMQERPLVASKGKEGGGGAGIFTVGPISRKCFPSENHHRSFSSQQNADSPSTRTFFVLQSYLTIWQRTPVISLSGECHEQSHNSGTRRLGRLRAPLWLNAWFVLKGGAAGLPPEGVSPSSFGSAKRLSRRRRSHNHPTERR